MDNIFYWLIHHFRCTRVLYVCISYKLPERKNIFEEKVHVIVKIANELLLKANTCLLLKDYNVIKIYLMTNMTLYVLVYCLNGFFFHVNTLNHNTSRQFKWKIYTLKYRRNVPFGKKQPVAMSQNLFSQSQLFWHSIP